MKHWAFAAALSLTPIIVSAQEQKPDVVLIPRDVAQMALNWIAAPDPTVAVRLYSALQACIQDNPHNGAVSRMGSDQCPVVTQAIEARTKEIADLQKQLADAKDKEAPKP